MGGTNQGRQSVVYIYMFRLVEESNGMPQRADCIYREFYCLGRELGIWAQCNNFMKLEVPGSRG